MHQAVATIIRTTIEASPPQNVEYVNNLVEDALAAAMQSLRATVSKTLKANPGGLAFSGDMLLNVPLIADWQEIHKHREQLVNKALHKSNKKMINYDCFIVQKVLKYDKSLTGKLASKTSGPFEITCVHMNGTVTVALCPQVLERLNVQRTIPYKEPIQA